MFVDIYNTNKTYKTIYLDPPWMERGGGKIKRGADKHYPLMKTEDIMKLPINKLADKDGCHLYLWTTNNFLPDALKCLDAWGFKYEDIITFFNGEISIEDYCKFILKKDEISKSDYIELYNAGFTSTEISRVAKCCDWTVRNYLKKNNITLRSPGKYKNTVQLSKYQKEIIDGEMLGDGHIGTGANYKNAYLDWNFKNLDHILFLCDNLKELNPKFSKRKDIGEKEGWRMWTQCNPYITEQKNRWYKNGIKIVPKDIELTPTVCFHWYIGDGSYQNGGIILYSLAFSLEENIFLSSKLNEIGIETTIRKRNYPSGEKYCIYIKRNSTPKFLNYIGTPDYVPCYSHKWGNTIGLNTLSEYEDYIQNQYYRGLTEHCIFAKYKTLPYKTDENGKRCQGITGFYESKKEHSRKPQKMREMIEKVSYEPRIELFARQEFNGWDCWGNEVIR